MDVALWLLLSSGCGDVSDCSHGIRSIIATVAAGHCCSRNDACLVECASVVTAAVTDSPRLSLASKLSESAVKERATQGVDKWLRPLRLAHTAHGYDAARWEGASGVACPSHNYSCFITTLSKTAPAAATTTTFTMSLANFEEAQKFAKLDVQDLFNVKGKTVLVSGGGRGKQQHDSSCDDDCEK